MNQFRKAMCEVCTVTEMYFSENQQMRACIEKRFMGSEKFNHLTIISVNFPNLAARSSSRNYTYN